MAGILIRDNVGWPPVGDGGADVTLRVMPTHMLGRPADFMLTSSLLEGAQFRHGAARHPVG